MGEVAADEGVDGQNGRAQTDVVVIGAGPAGLFSVFQLGILNLKAHVIDILDRPGGQCAELYPEKPIYDIPGFPEVTGQELTDRLLKQAEPFEPVFHLQELVSHLDHLESGRYLIKTDMGTEIECGAIIVAAGGGSFTPKRPPIPHIEDYEDQSVHYAVRRMEMFRDKRLVVAGGGDSALDWTIHLAPIARSLTLVHRRPGFRAAPDSISKMEELVEAGDIEFHVANIKGLEGEHGRLDAVLLNNEERGDYKIDCDMLLPFYGLTMKMGPVASFGFTFDDDEKIPVDTEFFATDRPGIFAVGDIATYPGKLKLILSAFHEVALAARGCFKTIHPDVELKLGYTTSNKALQKKIGVA
ncbi:MAG: NAD(P)/FAD-dependent oxidoreductase [Alphaproteobacteria bacterium]|nr:MAG: NAD(P)/FAD-dependent oxidoreductase [Alphaproteobacteria bacterium]